jgi:hypothetical protein
MAEDAVCCEPLSGKFPAYPGKCREFGFLFTFSDVQPSRDTAEIQGEEAHFPTRENREMPP